MSISCRWGSHTEAKKQGWFSRRHENPDAHQTEQARRDARVEARAVEGASRNEAWRKLTPTQQREILDARLGKGKGACRQRTKLGDQF